MENTQASPSGELQHLKTQLQIAETQISEAIDDEGRAWLAIASSFEDVRIAQRRMQDALIKIRDERLYRAYREGVTFAEYCQERWDKSKTHVNRLIAHRQRILAMIGQLGEPNEMTPMGVTQEEAIAIIEAVPERATRALPTGLSPDQHLRIVEAAAAVSAAPVPRAADVKAAAATMVGADRRIAGPKVGDRLQLWRPGKEDHGDIVVVQAVHDAHVDTDAGPVLKGVLRAKEEWQQQEDQRKDPKGEARQEKPKVVEGLDLINFDLQQYQRRVKKLEGMMAAIVAAYDRNDEPDLERTIDDAREMLEAA